MTFFNTLMFQEHFLRASRSIFKRWLTAHLSGFSFSWNHRKQIPHCIPSWNICEKCNAYPRNCRMKLCTPASFLLSREDEVVTRPLLSQVPQFQKKVNKSLEVIFPICWVFLFVCFFSKMNVHLYLRPFFFLCQHRRLFVSTFNFTPTVPVP